MISAENTKEGSDLALTGVTVVSTLTGELSPNMSILLRDGKISRIVPDATFTASPGMQVVAAEGKFLVPGFWDMHAHILEEEHRERSLALMLAHGVTGWRQMSGSLRLLEERARGSLVLGQDAPELLEMPGQIFTPANAPTPAASVAEVQNQKAAGADFIKTINVSPDTFFASLREARKVGLGYAGHLSLGVDAEDAAKAGMTAIEHLGPLDLQLITCSSRGWIVKLLLKLKPPPMPDLSPEKMQAIGKLIVANPTLFRLQMDPGGLAKSQRLVDSFSEAKCRHLGATCVQHGTWQVPTLIRIETMQFAEEPRFAQDPNLRYIGKATRAFWVGIAKTFADLVTPQGKETLRAMMNLALRMTKIFDEAGVQMLAGSDYGGMWVIPGVSLHQEFDLLEKAGLSPLKVLQMTTLNGARFLKREATAGTVDEGKDANLVLLDKNPIQSVQHLHGVYAVVRAGRFYSREALHALKESVIQSAGE